MKRDMKSNQKKKENLDFMNADLDEYDSEEDDKSTQNKKVGGKKKKKDKEDGA